MILERILIVISIGFLYTAYISTANPSSPEDIEAKDSPIDKSPAMESELRESLVSDFSYIDAPICNYGAKVKKSHI